MQSQTVEIVKSTVPLLEQHGRQITDVFYAKLFAANPCLRNVFNMTNQERGEQSQALSDAVLAYARHIDQLDVLLPVVERIAHKHVSLGIKPKQYALVGESLLEAIQEVLELPDDHAALGAWAEAYGALAEVFIGAEASLYRANSEQAGGWEGFREFYIDKVEAETPEVKSFYLRPLDGEDVPALTGGQYVGVRLRPDGSAHYQVRQYSLSQLGALRITVKAEPGGRASNHLHACNAGDVVGVQAPTGVFVLGDNRPKHVFVAGGVGITPMMGMLQDALARGVAGADLCFIQCAKSAEHLIFKRELEALQAEHGFVLKRCLESGDEGDLVGLLSRDVLQDWLSEGGFSGLNAQIYFCGPRPFMRALNQIAETIGFEDEDIHYEVFGPTTAL